MKKLLFAILLIGGLTYAQESSWNWATKAGGFIKTTSTAGDSLAFSGAWYTYTITADDTIYFSLNRDYPASDTKILLPDESYTSGKIDPFVFGTLYYKTKGTGAPNVRIFWEGK